MNLKRAAQALVECGYAKDMYDDIGDGLWNTYSTPRWYIFKYENHRGEEIVDPINNEAQRQALLEWFKVSVWYDDVGTWGASQSYFVDSDMPTYESNATRIEAENACLEEILK